MVDRLKLVGLSGDGAALDLADSAGTPYILEIDDRLRQAVVRDPVPADARPEREERALDTLSPRDIQSMIRAGADPRDLAAEYSLPLERVERFAGPPLAERAWVTEQARAVTVRGEAGSRGAEMATLDATVLDAALSAGAAADDIAWDAWRNDDGRWTVVASYPGSAGDIEESRWSFDARTRSLHPHGTPLNVVPPQASEVQAAEQASDEPAPRAEEPLSRVDASDADGAPDAGARGRKGRRASVPSWDEILFGAGQADS